MSRLADAQNRVGKLVIPEGRQLDDIRDVKTNNVTEGIFTLISNATCVDLDGDRRCVSADDLRDAASTASLAELSVPDWATKPVQAMGDDHRRLEGLIAPGAWDVDPPRRRATSSRLWSVPVRISTRRVGCSTRRSR